MNFAELEDVLRDRWLEPEERAVVEGLQGVLAAARPESLRAVRAERPDRYLHVELHHADGTKLDLLYGDGYTQVEWGHLRYAGWLEPEVMVRVLQAVMTGQLVKVQRYRLGRLVESYYEVDGGAPLIIGRGKNEWVGRRRSWSSRLLRRLPGLHEEIRRASLSFDRPLAARRPEAP